MSDQIIMDRITVTIPIVKKRQFTAILSARGESMTDFFMDKIEREIQNGKADAIKILKEKQKIING